MGALGGSSQGGSALAPPQITRRAVVPGIGSDSDRPAHGSLTGQFGEPNANGVEVAASVTNGDGVVALREPQDGSEIRVAVRNQSGSPVPGVQVAAVKSGTEVGIVIVDQSGQYLPYFSTGQGAAKGQLVQLLSAPPWGEVIEIVAYLQDAIGGIEGGAALVRIDLSQWQMFAAKDFSEFCTTAEQAGEVIDIATAGTSILYSAVTIGGGPLGAGIGLLIGAATDFFGTLVKEDLLSSPSEPVRIRIYDSDIPILGRVLQFVRIDRGACTVGGAAVRQVTNVWPLTITDHEIVIAWSLSSTGQVEDGFTVTIDGRPSSAVASGQTSFTFAFLTANTTYCITVVPFKEGASPGPAGARVPLCVATSGLDPEAPSGPSTTIPSQTTTPTSSPTGTSTPPGSSTPSPTPPAQPPVAPTNLWVGFGCGPGTITWSDNSDNETGFRLFERPVAWATPAGVYELGPNTTSYPRPCVPIALCFSVEAFNAVGPSLRTPEICN